MCPGLSPGARFHVSQIPFLRRSIREYSLTTSLIFPLPLHSGQASWSYFMEWRDFRMNVADACLKSAAHLWLDVLDNECVIAYFYFELSGEHVVCAMHSSGIVRHCCGVISPDESRSPAVLARLGADYAGAGCIFEEFGLAAMRASVGIYTHFSAACGANYKISHS